MNTFFIEFRDPLFSIIIFFTIIFIITFFSYWWGRYKRKEDSKQISKFLEQFRTLPSHNELKILIAEGGLSEKSWLLLASAYYKNGDYEKSIEIYNEILKLGNKRNTRETMFLLGKTYFKAGFLERSKHVFLEILKKNPRTPEALHYLLLVYEYMKDYKSALEVLEPLDELQEDVMLERAYLHVLETLDSPNMTKEEKVQKLLEIYKNAHRLAYLIFDYIFQVNPQLAWENIDISKSELLTELFWRCDSKDLNLDIITDNGYLRELYTARGDVKLAYNSSIFELDVLIKLEGKSNATLSFEYVCDNCKGTYPFAFSRCSSCHAIDTARVEYSLSKDYGKEFSEENNSFQ
ncbi:tetratricopeptide repeat protein [Sulfurimonas sp. SWIR-19]|uniref:tetratricopeptide repeat protein n=1 Tax=Sulfurimonas sp. SWIR-19 TaxID=2878390 RepID=UPI001CF5D0D9|nr:tetratricopeptide repeat protein [Sulfurimonas sp. SWIR-19]UCN00277.1 tetratricopeptide repeat protein [Sulfurimonas sp. SWIR-19]